MLKNRAIIIASFILAALIVKTDLLYWLFFLVVLGIIPGTSLTIPPLAYLLSLVGIVWFLSMLGSYKLSASLERHFTKSTVPDSTNLPRRRYAK